jgi:hypothetical protein
MGVKIIERKKQRKENRKKRVLGDFNWHPLRQGIDCDFPKVDEL